MKPLVFHLRPTAPHQYRLQQEGTEEAWEFADNDAALIHVAMQGDVEPAVVYLEDEAGARLVTVFV